MTVVPYNNFLGIQYSTPIVIRSVENTYVQDTHGHKRHYINNFQLWEFDIEFDGGINSTVYEQLMQVYYYPYGRTNANPDFQRPFLVDIPHQLNGNLSRNVIPAQVTVGYGGASAGAVVLRSKCARAYTIYAGTFINHNSSSHRKWYMVTTTKTAVFDVEDNGWNIDLDIYPPLLQDIGNNNWLAVPSSYNYRPLMLVKIVNDSLSFKYTSTGRQKISLTFREDLG